MGAPSLGPRPLHPLSPLLIGVAVALALGCATLWLCDDAYISFRYARHLAEGHGLVFNLGESPPIEAYSNLAWVLVLALGERLGLAAPSVAPLLSLGALAWLVGLVATDLGRWTRLGPWARLALVLILVGMPPMVVWGTSGLETMAFALSVYQVTRRLVVDPLLLAEPGDGSRVQGSFGLVAWVLLVVLLRVDGWVYLVGLGATGLLVSLSLGSAALRRRLVFLALGTLLALGIGLAVRLAVHGTWVPHTVRVKVEPSAIVFERGVRYVLAMCLAVPVLGLLQVLLFAHLRRACSHAVAILKGAAPSPSDTAPGGLILAAPPLVALATSLMVGGDFMAFARFFVPALPCLVLLLGLRLSVLPTRQSARTLALLTPVGLYLGGLALTDNLPVPAPLAERAHFRWNDDVLRSEGQVWAEMNERAKLWSNLGRALALHTQPGESLVVGAIGAIGYYSELFLLDTYGLVDLDIGLAPGHPGRHSPGHDKQVLDAYFLDREPTYFSGTALVHVDDPLAGIPSVLLDDPYLRQLFELELVELEDVEDTQLRLVRRRPSLR